MVLTTKVGRVGALYLASGTSATLADEAMQEVNLTAEGRPRYTVYEIASADHRYADDGTALVFQADTAGNGSFSAITPYKIEYPGTRIYLSAARGATDVIRCHSGKYIPMTMCIGAMNWSLDASWETDKIMLLRDTAKTTIMKQKQWSAQATLALAKTCAAYTTALTGSMNNIYFVDNNGGVGGNGATGGYTITYADPGGVSATLSISMSGNDITVNLGRAASAINTTSNAIVNLWGISAILRELKVTAAIKTGEDGTGLVTALAKQNFAGGLNSVDYSGVSGLAVAVFFSDYDADARWEDYTRITKADLKMPADGQDTVSITFETYGGPHAGPFLRKS
jgi:hypothetical protein